MLQLIFNTSMASLCLHRDLLDLITVFAKELAIHFFYAETCRILLWSLMTKILNVINVYYDNSLSCTENCTPQLLNIIYYIKQEMNFSVIFETMHN